MSVIIGLSTCGGHDSAAALIKDGRLIAAMEEERFRRIKHFPDFPKLAIEECLRMGRVSPGDVEYVGLPWHPSSHMGRRLRFLFFFNGPHRMVRRARFVMNLSRQIVTFEEKLHDLFPRAKIIYIEHHMSHAASAFYASPFKEAAIFTMDGRGEWPTLLLAEGLGSGIRKIQELYYPHSLGELYLAFTLYLGFESNDEYKVMGLAPYGKPIYTDIFRRLVRFNKKNIVDIDPGLLRHPGYARVEWGGLYYTDKVISIFGPPRKRGAPIEQRHMDIAASLQARFNEIGVEIAQHLHSITKKRFLCMAGGVALNGVMNYKIKTETPFEDIFVQPAAGDGGTALGSALYIENMVCRSEKRVVFEHAYLGPEYSSERIREELDANMLQYIVLDNPSRVGAFLLKEGYVIGWFQGRSEYGPRALGNRSILADPRKPEYKDIVNSRIKFREEFRPFAPSVIADFADDYFVDCRGSAAPYMLFVAPVKPGKENAIPAVTHIDGTGRVQIVNQNTNPLYYSLINHFYKFTGIPVVLNTSFNVKGEPIVNSPSDALRCYFSTGLDFLIMGNFLVFKKSLPENLRDGIDSLVKDNPGHIIR